MQAPAYLPKLPDNEGATSQFAVFSEGTNVWPDLGRQTALTQEDVTIVYCVQCTDSVLMIS